MQNGTPKTIETRERLSAVAHNSWAHWMWHVFNTSQHNPDGSVTLSADDVLRWRRQIVTQYADLTEQEKESDRREADRMIAALNPTATQRN